MRQMDYEGELIWLRQSATFTVNGQTRTVEIAVPVRPDASAEEVEALMRQARMGMDALTRQLDTRIAALLSGEEQAALPAHVAPAVAAPVAPAPTSSATTPASTEPAPSIAPTPATPTAAAAAPPPEVPTQAARSTTQPAVPDRPKQPAAQQPAPVRANASGSLHTQPPETAPQPARPAAASGPDLSRAEFISATAEMGLNPAQAMERLGVRSLQGLNLREALEALRRQLVRDGGGDAPAAPAQGSRAAQPARGAAPASAASQPPAPGRREPTQPQPPRYFEEEDEMDGREFTFTVDDSGDIYDEFGQAVGEEAASYSADSVNGASDEFGALDDLDDFDLDDVPDFGPPPTPARTAPAAPLASPAPAAARRGTARAGSAPSAAEPEEVAAAPATEGRSLGLQRVGYFRGVRGGGAATGQQRMAYRNIIVRELGDGDARALVQGIWRVTPDRLGGEQLDALVSWGKRDTFSEEAALVLAVLQEERERNDNAATAAETPAEAAPPRQANPPRTSGTAAAPAQRPPARQRPAAARPTPQSGDN